MKKTLLAIMLIMILLVVMAGCGRALPDFKKAYIKLPGGQAVTVDVKSWSYLDMRGNKMLIIDENGDRYICSSFNVTMIEDDSNVIDTYNKNSSSVDEEAAPETP